MQTPNSTALNRRRQIRELRRTRKITGLTKFAAIRLRDRAKQSPKVRGTVELRKQGGPSDGWKIEVR